MKKYLVMLLCIIIVLTMLTGCNQKNLNNNSGNNENNKEETKAEKPEDTKEFYIDFLNGKTKMYVGEELFGLEIGKEYSISEIAESLGEYWKDEEPAKITSLGYAFIDAGMDGNLELVMNMSVSSPNGMYLCDEYIIAKKMEDRLNFITCEETFYRSYASINEYGVIETGGSISAFASVQNISIITAEGEKKFIYGRTCTLGLAGAYVPASEISESDIPDGYPDDFELFTDDSDCFYECDTLHFDEYVSDDSDNWLANYEAYLREGMFLFYDPDGEEVEADDEYKEAYKQNGIKCLTGDEGRKLIQDKYDAYGITDEMLEGNGISWVEVEADFIEKEEN